MSSTTVAIELLSDRLDVALLKGSHPVSRRRLLVDLPTDPTAWAKAVRSCTDQLKEAVTELGAEGNPARVIYRSPSQVVDLASFELRSASQACAAAALPCLEALPYSANSAICRAAAVGRDRSGPKRRWHIVVAADRVDIIRTLADVVESAGLVFTSATPIDATIMSRLVGEALRYAGPQHGWLHFGSQSSFFILGAQGTVRFERSIGLGVETVIRSLTRPIRMPDEDPVEIDLDTATKLVYEKGIPDNDEVVHEGLQLSRRHIMPQIQPVLQRYIVELRQSLRFGLDKDERESIAITVMGPGSSIPGIADLVGHELRLQLTSDPRYAEFDYRTAASRGSELVEALGDEKFLDKLNVQPAEMAQRQQIGRLRRWLWSGAAAALIVIGADGFRYQAALDKATQKASALATKNQGLETLKTTHELLVAAIDGINELEKTMSEDMGVKPDLHAILLELSRLTPETVKLTSIRLGREGEVMTARLYGRAVQLEDNEETELEAFIESLKASPVFRDAILRNVEVGFLGEQAGQRFEASLEAYLVPDPDLVAAVVAAEGGPSQ